jgi:hypothetical protein
MLVLPLVIRIAGASPQHPPVGQVGPGPQGSDVGAARGGPPVPCALHARSGMGRAHESRADVKGIEPRLQPLARRCTDYPQCQLQAVQPAAGLGFIRPQRGHPSHVQSGHTLPNECFQAATPCDGDDLHARSGHARPRVRTRGDGQPLGAFVKRIDRVGHTVTRTVRSTVARSYRRRDVGVEPEYIRRVVGVFQGHQARVFRRPIGGLDAVHADV